MAPEDAGPEGGMAPEDAGPEDERPRMVSLGTDCDPVRAQTHCAALTDEGVALLGIDTGQYCVLPVEGIPPVSNPSGLPISLAWVGASFVACVATPSRIGELIRVSPELDAVTRSERECLSAVGWQDGLLLSTFSDGALYPDFDTATRGEPGDPFDGVALPSASHAGRLYGLIDGPPGRRLVVEEPGGTDLWNELDLALPAPLLAEDTFVTGVDLTSDGRIVLLREGRLAGVEVYDATTLTLLSMHAASVPEQDWSLKGLACDGG